MTDSPLKKDYMFRYETVKGFFLQDDLSTEPSTFDIVRLNRQQGLQAGDSGYLAADLSVWLRLFIHNYPLDSPLTLSSYPTLEKH